MHQRLAKKLAHPPVDFARPKVVVIEKDLELGACFLVVIWQRDPNLRAVLGRRSLANGLRFLDRFSRRWPSARAKQ